MKRNYLLIIFFLISDYSFPQQSYLSKQVNILSEYIASEQFGTLKDSTDHLSLMDTLYKFSLRANNNDISEALLSLTFACIPYKEFPVTIPLLNISIQIPLLSADDSVFLAKNENLPSRLFFDTPNNKFGDKDKVAHFFGNAFIGYNSTFMNLGNFLGLFVEVFEESFKVQSRIDERDLTANYYGRVFGRALRDNEFVLPSQSLILHSLFYSVFML